MGGYQPVTDQDEQSSIQKDLAPLAFQNFTSTHTVTGCMANTVKPVAYNITKACKQVLLLAPSSTGPFCLSAKFRKQALRQDARLTPPSNRRSSINQGSQLQVVAGTNYAFALSSSYDCTSTSNSPATGAVLLNSIVYQPLPSGGQNAKPQASSGRSA